MGGGWVAQLALPYLIAPSSGGCEEGMGGGWVAQEIPLSPDMLEEVMEAGPV